MKLKVSNLLKKLSIPSSNKRPTQISVAARNSPLSKAQVKEAEQALQQYYPYITFSSTWLKTKGDLNQKISLRNLDKTDFFTREIDAYQLSKKCQISIHSAKDLPPPLPQGLTIAALTRCIDPSDSLVLRQKETLKGLKPHSLIATSSLRRELIVKELRHDLDCVDIRGNIQQRLDKLNNHEIDGLIVAEAALIRLKLTHLNRISLPNNTAPLQGQLAILALESDDELMKIFSCIDVRKKDPLLRA